MVNEGFKELCLSLRVCVALALRKAKNLDPETSGIRLEMSLGCHETLRRFYSQVRTHILCVL